MFISFSSFLIFFLFCPVILQHHLYAVQSTTCLWDTQCYSSLPFQQLVNHILTPWVVAYQVMWLMESLHQPTFIPFGQILGMGENLFNFTCFFCFIQSLDKGTTKVCSFGLAGFSKWPCIADIRILFIRILCQKCVNDCCVQKLELVSSMNYSVA